MLKTSSDVLKLISSSLSPLTSLVIGAPQMPLQQYVLNVFEPGHEKTCLMPYANNKGADQQIVVRCLDSIISLDSIAEISRLYLASVAAQAGLCLAWSVGNFRRHVLSCRGSFVFMSSILSSQTDA